MKNRKIIFACMIICTACISCGKKIGPEKPLAPDASKRMAVVTAATNLVMRAKPDKTAVKVGVVPHGETVEILGESDTEMQIDTISSKWYRVSYKGLEGWVFGGYLSIKGEKKLPALKEELDPKSYIGREYTDIEQSLNKRVNSSSILKNGLSFTAFSYEGYYMLIVMKQTGTEGSKAIWRITDAMKMRYESKRERIFFPYGLCKSEGMYEPILAVAEEPGYNCTYTAISRAWTVDKDTMMFSPAMAEGMSCRPECCGDGCR